MECWKLTDQELEELKVRGGNVSEAQKAKRRAFLDNGGVILNPDALTDLYEAAKELWRQLDKRRIDYCLCDSLTEICWYCTMLQPIEQALAKANS